MWATFSMQPLFVCTLKGIIFKRNYFVDLFVWTVYCDPWTYSGIKGIVLFCNTSQHILSYCITQCWTILTRTVLYHGTWYRIESYFWMASFKMISHPVFFLLIFTSLSLSQCINSSVLTEWPADCVCLCTRVCFERRQRHRLIKCLEFLFAAWMSITCLSVCVWCLGIVIIVGTFFIFLVKCFVVGTLRPCGDIFQCPLRKRIFSGLDWFQSSD